MLEKHPREEATGPLVPWVRMLDTGKKKRTVCGWSTVDPSDLAEVMVCGERQTGSAELYPELTRRGICVGVWGIGLSLLCRPTA